MSTVPSLPTLLTIGEVSRRSGVAASALRFYEQRGLVGSERAGSGHRRYHRAVLRRIAFIVFAQRIGLTLDEIGVELSRLPSGDAPSRNDWSRLSETWTGCLSIDRCRLANPRDSAARLGPGPRYWVGDHPPGAADRQTVVAAPVAESATGATAS